jgi:hypothetical protein
MTVPVTVLDAIYLIRGLSVPQSQGENERQPLPLMKKQGQCVRLIGTAAQNHGTSLLNHYEWRKQGWDIMPSRTSWRAA